MVLTHLFQVQVLTSQFWPCGQVVYDTGLSSRRWRVRFPLGSFGIILELLFIFRESRKGSPLDFDSKGSVRFVLSLLGIDLLQTGNKKCYNLLSAKNHFTFIKKYVILQLTKIRNCQKAYMACIHYFGQFLMRRKGNVRIYDWKTPEGTETGTCGSEARCFRVLMAWRNRALIGMFPYSLQFLPEHKGSGIFLLEEEKMA